MTGWLSSAFGAHRANGAVPNRRSQLVRFGVIFAAVNVVLQGLPWLVGSFAGGSTTAGFPFPVWSCHVEPPVLELPSYRACHFSQVGLTLDVVLSFVASLALVRFSWLPKAKGIRPHQTN